MKAAFVHGGNIYDAGPPKDGWLDFSANINPLGLSAKVQAVLQQQLGEVVHYPDPQGRRLKRSLSDAYHVPADHLVLGNGAAELFYVFFHTFRPSRVLIPVPSFSEYERAALAAGLQVDYFPLQPQCDFILDLPRLLAKLPQTDCVILGNPNNPTGNLLPRGVIEAIAAEAARHEVWVLIDESFIDFRQDAELYTAYDLLEKYERICFFHSLTKFYAIPGLRLGFGILRPQQAALLDLHKDPWNVNLLAQLAGIAAVQDNVYQQKTYQLLARETAFLFQGLMRFSGIRIFPSTVNFILMDFADRGLSAENIAAKMKEKGILIRDCSNYPGLGNTFVRIAIRSREENEKILQAFAAILGA